MSIKCLLFGFCILMITASCSKKEKLVEENIIGKWTNATIEVTYHNGETMMLKPEDWKEKLGMQPLKFTFLSDSTYSMETFSSSGKLYKTNFGNWLIKDDSLVLKTVYDYRKLDVEELENAMILRGIFDYDNDMKLDQYTGYFIKD